MKNTGKGEASLVIGANGLVGRHLSGILTLKGISWKGTYHARPEKGLSKLDITDPGEVGNFFEGLSPRVVFHCANLGGGVDFCESNPEKAAAFHLHAVQTIGGICAKIGATLVFISSDYVFDGTKGPYKEDDLPNPLNVYGRLKLAAEEWIGKNVESHIIIRTTNVFGWDPETVTPNYMMGLYRAVTAGKQFNAPSYLWGNPTYVDDLAGAMIELYQKKAGGVFHVVGKSFVNRFDWAKTACAILGLDSKLIREVSAPPVNMVPRPIESSLNTDKFAHFYGTVLHDVREGLGLMKKEMKGR